MFSLIAALTVFTIIIVLSSFGKTQANLKQSQQMKMLTWFLFDESIFPTALFKTDLKLILANKSFKSTFMNTASAKESVSMADIKSLWLDKKSADLLSHLQATRSLPESPFFINIEFTEDSGEKENYVLFFRHCDNLPTSEPLITLKAINNKYTMNIAEDLVNKIAERETSLKKLEEVDRLKSEFLATLSHELKTPLVSIKGYLDLIASKKMGPLTEKQAKALQVSQRNASHLNSLISSMLNFARMEAGKLMFDLVHQKLPPRISETIDSMRPIAENRNVMIQNSFDPDLPAVVFDPELMHRVMCNLLENAIKFSATNSEINVDISLHSPQLVKVQVKDFGCGIPADKLELIKTPFYQIAKSDTRPTSGLGLGLAICEKILIGHGTTLNIESQENKGTTCSFHLKVAN